MDHTYVFGMVKSLQNCSERVHAYYLHYSDGRPAEESMARDEVDSFVDSESIINSWSLGMTLIEYTSDHVSLFLKSLVPPVEVAASVTCVRSMMECSSLSAWFMDPSIDAEERVRRTLSHRFQGMAQQLKLTRSVSQKSVETQSVEMGMTELELKACKLGFPVGKCKRQRTIWVGCVAPSATELIQQVYHDEKLYRLLSAISHGHHWALGPIQYQELSDWSDFGVHGKQLEKVVRSDLFALLGQRTAIYFLKPLWNQCLYFGWNSLKLEEIFEDTADEMRLSREVRFWRS